MTHAAQSVSPWPAAEPATQFACAIEPRPAQLPDPVAGGALRTGLVGKVHLLTAAHGPAEVAGDVTVAVYDASPRPPGSAARTTEVFHFEAAKVRQLRTSDERFGTCHALFLPLPDDWKDVSVVRILARYDPPAGTALFAGDTRLALDRSAAGSPVWADVGDVGVPPPPPHANPAAAALSVPSGAAVAARLTAGQPVAAAPVRQAAAQSPIVPPIPPPSAMPPVSAVVPGVAPPAAAGGVQPLIVNRPPVDP